MSPCECDIHLPHDYHVVCNVGDDDAGDHETNHVYCHKNVLQVLTFFPSHKSKQLTKSHNPKAEADTCGRLIIPSATAGTTSQPPRRVISQQPNPVYLSTLAWLGVRSYGVPRLLLLRSATAGNVVVRPARGTIAAGAAVGVHSE